jgi:beta-N-acetylhexosaminidase
VGTEQGTIKALQAGIDLMLVSHHYSRQRGSLEAIQAAVQDGTLSADRVRQAAERVLQLKAGRLSWDNLPDATAITLVGNEAHQQLRDRAYELSTTLVRDADGLLPLRLQPEQRLLILFLQPTNSTQAIDAGLPGDALIENIKKRHEQVDTLFIAPQPTPHEYEAIYQAVKQAAITIVVTANANLDFYQGHLMRQLLQTGQPIIGIAAHNPYDLLAFPELGTYLVTYEYTQPAFAAVVRVLFGEIQAQGHLPVSLPGLYSLVQH